MSRLDRRGPLRLVLQARRGAGDPIGVRAAPPYLPDALWRWPGESPEAFYRRVVQAAVGSGVVVAPLVYPDELPSTPSGAVH